MSEPQTGILAPLPALGRYLSFSARPQGELRAALRALAELADGQRLVVGLGESLLRALGREIPGLHSFASAVGPGLELPATPAALWCWLRGDDRGDLVHLTRKVQAAVDGALALDQVIEQVEPLGADDKLSRQWPAPDLGVDKHRIYMVQWYAFAALAFGLWAWFTLIRRKR